MITATLKSLYARDLIKLKQKLVLYSSEENTWLIDQAASEIFGQWLKPNNMQTLEMAPRNIKN